MPALQHFFDAERKRRGWSMREAADRSSISVSKAYAIANGDDNVEFETFENIAIAFGMTPAELAVVIGKGAAEHDPEEVEWLTVLRQLPDHVRSTLLIMARGATVQPLNRGPDNRRRDGRPNRMKARSAELDASKRMPDDPAANDELTARSLHDHQHWMTVPRLERRLPALAV